MGVCLFKCYTKCKIVILRPAVICKQAFHQSSEQWRKVAPVAPASLGGAMRRGRQNFEIKLFDCKNVPYVGQINVRWWGKIQKAPGGAKKLQETVKIL